MPSIGIGVGIDMLLATGAAHPGAVQLAAATAKWLPSSLVDSSGKVTSWPSTGGGGSNYDLLSLGGATDPTYVGNGNRAGGPACRLVRASATKLASIAFAISQPNTFLWIVKLNSENANMRLVDGRTGNTHGIFYTAETFVCNDGAGTTVVDNTGAITTATWYALTAVYGGSGAGASSMWRNRTKTAGTLAGTGCSGIVLGDFGTGGGAAFDADVEQGYFFNTAKSDAEIVQMLEALGF